MRDEMMAGVVIGGERGAKRGAERGKRRGVKGGFQILKLSYLEE
jgi:hypothetical protein